MTVTQFNFAEQMRNTIFSRGGTLLSPGVPAAIDVWTAPFPCTVTAIKAIAQGASGSSINARKNGSLNHLASDLVLSSTGSWLDGGSVQNTSYAEGDSLQIMLTELVGSPTEIAIQVDFTRP